MKLSNPLQVNPAALDARAKIRTATSASTPNEKTVESSAVAVNISPRAQLLSQSAIELQPEQEQFQRERHQALQYQDLKHNKTSPSEAKNVPSLEQLPTTYAPVQQRAIDFYNITAAITNSGGDGELIGVDTYA